MIARYKSHNFQFVDMEDTIKRPLLYFPEELKNYYKLPKESFIFKSDGIMWAHPTSLSELLDIVVYY